MEAQGTLYQSIIFISWGFHRSCIYLRQHVKVYIKGLILPMWKTENKDNTRYLKTWHLTSTDHHDGVMAEKRYPSYWPCVREIHRSVVDSPHKGPVTRELLLSLMLVQINAWTNILVACDLRRHDARCDVTVIMSGHGYTGKADFNYQREIR